VRAVRHAFAALVVCAAAASGRAAVIEVRPGRSIGQAVRRARKGDTVAVRAGVYKERTIIPSDGVTVVSADGPGKAKVDAGGREKTFFLWQRKGVTVDGFECYNSGENVVMVTQSSNCVLRNLYVHDAGTGGDCIKINAGTEDLLVENCVAHTPGAQPGRDEVEECIDMMNSTRVTIRGCWFYYTGRESRANQLGYSKCDSFDIVWDGNVFGPTHPKSAVGDAALGGGWAGSNKSGWNTVGVTYRNNLFIDCHHGALGIYGQKDVYIVNNTFVNNGHVRNRDIIDIHEGGRAQHSENIHIFSNIFVDYAGKMPSRGVLGKTNGTWKNVVSGGNIYWNAGKPVPSSALLNPRREPGARFVDPGLLARAVPEITDETTRESLMKLFGLRAGSSAIDAAPEHPDEKLKVAADALGTKRPQGKAFDIGAVEYKVATKTVVAKRQRAAGPPPAAGPLAAHADGIAEARKLAAAGDLEAAREKAATLAGSTKLNDAHAALRGMAEGFADAAKLRKIIIDRHGERKPTVYVDFGGRAQRAKIVSADGEGISASLRGVSVPIPWAKLRPGRFCAMAAKFCEERSAPEQLALARYAAASGLKDETEKALQAYLAAGGKASVAPLRLLVK